MKVAIKAYEDIYQGLHEMYSLDIVDVDSWNEAFEIAQTESYEVMENYNILDEIYEEAIEEGIEEDSSEMGNYIENAIAERSMYDIHKIKEGVDKDNLSLLEIYRNNEEYFLKEYCEDEDI